MACEIAASLRGWALCRRRAPAEVEALAAIAEPVALAGGDELFREGDAGDGVYLVCSGAALEIVAGIAEALAHRLAATSAKVIELGEKIDGAGDSKAKDDKLAELHRSLQIWSF